MDAGFGQKQSADASSAATAAASARRNWTRKFGLKGHFDAVRSIVFHPSEPYLFSAGEDGLVMLWNLRRSGSPKPVSFPPLLVLLWALILSYCAKTRCRNGYKSADSWSFFKPITSSAISS